MIDLLSSDGTLVSLVKQGGPSGDEAYARLVCRHQPSISRMVRGLATESEIDDITQDTFLSGWLDLKHLENNAAFPGWIRKVATHKSHQNHRRRGAQRQYDALAVSSANQVDAARTLQTADSVRFVLSQLDITQQEVLLLRFVGGLDMNELSTALDVGTSAAKMRLKRARDEFKTVYKTL